nr:MAG TPA: hypothetical protein [Caudoviricetes sp.]
MRCAWLSAVVIRLARKACVGTITIAIIIPVLLLSLCVSVCARNAMCGLTRVVPINCFVLVDAVWRISVRVTVMGAMVCRCDRRQRCS